MRLGLIAAAISLAAADGIPPELIDPLSRTGITGVMVGLVVWLVMKSDRKTGEGLKALSASIDRQSGAIDKLRENCAAIRKE